MIKDILFENNLLRQAFLRLMILTGFRGANALKIVAIPR